MLMSLCRVRADMAFSVGYVIMDSEERHKFIRYGNL